MSFKCQLCLYPQPAHIRPTVVQMQVREVEYQGYCKGSPGAFVKKYLRSTSEGTETVREVRACESCAEDFLQCEPNVLDTGLKVVQYYQKPKPIEEDEDGHRDL